jgi:hypothetical protein
VASLLGCRGAPGCRHPRRRGWRVWRDSVSLLPFAGGIGEPARLASRDQASPGSRLSPVREFIGGRHLEGAGSCPRAVSTNRRGWRPVTRLHRDRDSRPFASSSESATSKARAGRCERVASRIVSRGVPGYRHPRKTRAGQCERVASLLGCRGVPGCRHPRRRGRAGESAWLRSSVAVASPAVVTLEDAGGAV